jgi:hypothetical protein
MLEPDVVWMLSQPTLCQVKRREKFPTALLVFDRLKPAFCPAPPVAS